MSPVEVMVNLCGICGGKVESDNARLCNGCWEVKHRLCVTDPASRMFFREANTEYLRKLAQAVEEELVQREGTKRGSFVFAGQDASGVCDRRCEKAWGRNGRPRVHTGDGEDDWEYLADQELGEAPGDPGTWEGGEGKPRSPDEGEFNKWCVRECERFALGGTSPIDWSVRRGPWGERREQRGETMKDEAQCPAACRMCGAELKGSSGSCCTRCFTADSLLWERGFIRDVTDEYLHRLIDGLRRETVKRAEKRTRRHSGGEDGISESERRIPDRRGADGVFYHGPVSGVCDGRCRKAWGISSRPTVKTGPWEEDWAYLADSELQESPPLSDILVDGYSKPHVPQEGAHLWCIRECERCTFVPLQEEKSARPLDWNVRRNARRERAIPEGDYWSAEQSDPVSEEERRPAKERLGRR